jgi:hypothetical protein
MDLVDIVARNYTDGVGIDISEFKNPLVKP